MHRARRSSRLAVQAAAITLALLAAQTARATTWDEPWTDQVVARADTFAEIEIVTGGAHGVPVTAKVIAVMAGKDALAVGETIELRGFFLLDLGSVSAGHGPEYRFAPGRKMLCLLRAHEAASAGDHDGHQHDGNDGHQHDGNDGHGHDRDGHDAKPAKPKLRAFSLPTPTGGYADIQDDGTVIGQVRHSKHQGIFARADFVTVMTAMFETLHGGAPGTAFVDAWVGTYLSKPPAEIEGDPTSPEALLFFSQHLALEALIYFGRPEHITAVMPFLANDFEHNRISAARALGTIGGERAIEALLDRVASDDSDFVKVVAVWSLERLAPASALPRLKQLANTASDAENGFGGNLMDPRIATWMPSVKGAIQCVVARLEAAGENAGEPCRRSPLREGLQAAPGADTAGANTGATPDESGPAGATDPTHPGRVHGRRGCGCDAAADSSERWLAALAAWLLILWCRRRRRSLPPELPVAVHVPRRR